MEIFSLSLIGASLFCIFFKGTLYLKSALQVASHQPVHIKQVLVWISGTLSRPSEMAVLADLMSGIPANCPETFRTVLNMVLLSRVLE